MSLCSLNDIYFYIERLLFVLLSSLYGYFVTQLLACVHVTVLQIFSYVDITDLARCACVCRSWKVITQSNMLWSTVRKASRFQKLIKFSYHTEDCLMSFFFIIKRLFRVLFKCSNFILFDVLVYWSFKSWFVLCFIPVGPDKSSAQVTISW